GSKGAAAADPAQVVAGEVHRNVAAGRGADAPLPEQPHTPREGARPRTIPGFPWAIQHIPARAVGVFLVTASVDAVLGLLAWPRGADLAVPALAFVLVIIVILAWVLSFLSFQFDVHRVPVVVAILAIVLSLQLFIPNNHSFPTYPWPPATPLPLASDAIQARWERGGKGPGVIVAASGGGITASLWTAVVLERLHQEIPEFGPKVLLLSSVSGGGV